MSIVDSGTTLKAELFRSEPFLLDSSVFSAQHRRHQTQMSTTSKCIDRRQSLR